jgi:Protein of unknown function (DUF3108)
MARWLKRALLPLAIVLLLVLAAHGVALWGIAKELQAATSVITAQVDPLFTRQITQQNATTVAPEAPKPPKLERNRPLAQQNNAQAAPKSVASKVTQTAPITLPEEATVSAAVSPTPSMAESTPSLVTSPGETVAIAEPTVTATVTATTASTTSLTVPDASASLALQGNWPSDTRLTYDLGGNFRGELHGNAQVQWTRLTPPQASLTTVATPGDRYQVRINMNIGLIEMQFASQGRIRATGLQPEAYEEQLPNGGRRKLTLERRELVLNNGTRVPRPDIGTDAVQDTASQFVELGQRFSDGRARLAPGESVRVWLARPGGLDEWTYDVGPAETLYLPTLGAVQAYGLTPRPLANPRGPYTVQMWFAPSLQNLPVRIKLHLSSEAYLDLMVKKIEQR